MKMDEQTKNDIPTETEDEIGKVTIEQLKENVNNDIVNINKRLEQLEKERTNYKEQLKVDEKIWEIVQRPGALRKIEPTFEFEKDEEYWKAQEQKQYFKIRESQAMAKGQLEMYNTQEKELKSRLESAEEKLNALEEDGQDEQ